MLTFRATEAYLLREGLIDARSAVMGGLTITDSSRRNHSFQITRSDGPWYLLKQGFDLERQAAIQHEAQVYAFLKDRNQEEGILQYLPYFYRYDPADSLLVLEMVRGAQTLREYHLRRRRFSPRLAALLGRALAALHRLEHPPEQAGSQPWILSVHLPGLNIFQDFSSANIQLIKIIQGYPDFCELLDALRASWRIEALIHNDIKWDNCLVYGKEGAARITRLKLIDWEQSDAGDPAWDVGSVFAEYLSFWLLSIPITGETPLEQYLDLARFPLEAMQPAMRCFWNSYTRHSGLASLAAAQMLQKAVQFGAARLIHTAMEQMQNAAQLTRNTLAMLQLCYNILARPEQAIVHLLGIPQDIPWNP
jgi:aminoglycoside phosphotransferase (APT) family kinase protein